MFGLKNKAFQIQMVDPKGQPTNGTTTNVYNVDPEETAKVATDVIVKTVTAVGAVIAGHKVLTTICDVAIIAAKAKFK